MEVRGLLFAAALAVVGMGCAGAAGFAPSASGPGARATQPELAQGWNPHPVRLRRPPVAPLSAMARLGRRIFYDASLSSSGRRSCASCHDPRRAYGPPDAGPAEYGGPDLLRQGVRAVPSLDYLERQPPFSIGPDNEENENVSLRTMAAAGKSATRVQKKATQEILSARNLVPQGGLFWDGRADRLQRQAFAPLLDPREMDGGDVSKVARKLQAARYADRMTRLFGTSIFSHAHFAVSEALFAVARFEIEDPSFHPYSSRFDFWLEGKARLSAKQLRGYALFNDPEKANCGGCHVDQPTPDGRPPLFTDHQYEALGVPRNPALAANRDPDRYDLGLCGPYRKDLAGETNYCGLFATPTLRNVATRPVFFHNGVYRTLRQVLDFYDFRDVAPEKIYPSGRRGVEKFDDIPARYRANVDIADPPFNRSLGQKPAMTSVDEEDVIAFLKTLTDGYRPSD